MTDLELLNKLCEIQKENGVLYSDTILGYTDDGKAIRVQDVHSLELYDTDVKKINEIIGCLDNLQRLVISGSPFLEMVGEEIVINPQKLDDSRVQLNALMEVISNLTGLKELDISETELTSLPESIGNICGLKRLYASDTNLISLPDSIGNLTDLQKLDVSGTHITSLLESIGNLTSLQELDISATKLTSLPESIGNLTGLQELDISVTKLTSLPESIGNLTSLQALNVSGTQLTSLPESIGNLTGLQELDVSETHITSLPESIGNLTSLQALNVNGTQLTSLPESIGNLTGLLELGASETQITVLPESIGNLNNLRNMNVSRTNITSLPKSIKKLENLKRMDISGTAIHSINDELCSLPSIRELFLKDLSLDRIPKKIIDLKLDFKTRRIRNELVLRRSHDISNGIYINNLSLSKQPISLFYQKRELIEQYFNEDQISVNSAKIIFLGDGGVGKTYTLKRLLNDGKKATGENPYLTQTTHGVLIKHYHVTDVDGHHNIKLWDFGGQQVMHSMHRCFLTERSCYVIIISTRTDRDLLEQARYWLRTVSSFAPGSPVIVLVNQWTKNLIEVDEYRLRSEFKNIQKFLYFSIVEAEDEVFLSLRDSIFDQVRRLDCYGMEFPKSWYDLMTELETLTENYISETDYHLKCFKKGICYEKNNEGGIYEWLLDWFNDLGVCFSYHKNSNSQILKNYELLNPQWLTRAAYVLINKGKEKSDNGILTKEEIQSILSETESLDFDDLGCISYSEKEIDYILEVLRKFMISYQFLDGRELIPALCDVNSSGSRRPDWFNPNDMQHTSYEFEYKYLPDTIIHRLMIFFYLSHYHVRYRWRKGMRVDFSSDGTSKLTAVIDSGNNNQSVSIDIYSDGRIPCWQFLSKIREEILQINTRLNLEAKDFINMETGGIRDRFSVEAVLRARARGLESFPASTYDGDYKISDILGSAYGTANAAIIEKVSVLQKGKINIDTLNQILSMHEQLENAIIKLDDRIRDIQIHQYLMKDEIIDELAKAFRNQEEITALLNTLNKKPSNIKSLANKTLSGIAVTADLVTLVEAANPGLVKKTCKNAAGLLEKLLPMFFIIRF